MTNNTDEIFPEKPIENKNKIVIFHSGTYLNIRNLIKAFQHKVLGDVVISCIILTNQSKEKIRLLEEYKYNYQVVSKRDFLTSLDYNNHLLGIISSYDPNLVGIYSSSVTYSLECFGSYRVVDLLPRVATNVSINNDEIFRMFFELKNRTKKAPLLMIFEITEGDDKNRPKPIYKKSITHKLFSDQELEDPRTFTIKVKKIGIEVIAKGIYKGLSG